MTENRGGSRRGGRPDFPLPPAFVANVLQGAGETGRLWLESLLDRVQDYCVRWDLSLDGEPWHGYMGLVLPVRQGDCPAALKLTRADTETRDEALALRVWDGNGAVKLFDSDPGVLLLERLHAQTSLRQLPIRTATEIAAGLVRRLAVPAPEGLLELEPYTRDLEALALQRWERFDRPFPLAWLPSRPETQQRLLVNQDLHFENVLAGEREPWLVIDPKPLSGDSEFSVAPLLWNRWQDDDPLERFDRIVSGAELHPERALDWTLFRVLEYWLWALSLGFTEDPPRCRELAHSLSSRRRESGSSRSLRT